MSSNHFFKSDEKEEDKPEAIYSFIKPWQLEEDLIVTDIKCTKENHHSIINSEEFNNNDTIDGVQQGKKKSDWTIF